MLWKSNLLIQILVIAMIHCSTCCAKKKKDKEKNQNREAQYRNIKNSEDYKMPGEILVDHLKDTFFKIDVYNQETYCPIEDKQCADEELRGVIRKIISDVMKSRNNLFGFDGNESENGTSVKPPVNGTDQKTKVNNTDEKAAVSTTNKYESTSTASFIANNHVERALHENMFPDDKILPKQIRNKMIELLILAKLLTDKEPETGDKLYGIYKTFRVDDKYKKERIIKKHFNPKLQLGKEQEEVEQLYGIYKTFRVDDKYRKERIIKKPFNPFNE